MALDREAIFVALFARIQALTAWGFSSRTFQTWDDTPPSASPACFLAKDTEDPTTIVGLPQSWRIRARVVVYALNESAASGIAPSTQLNQLLTALEGALERKPIEGPAIGAPFPQNPGGAGTTLGGLCYSCQIVGTVETFEGLVGGNAVMVVPIEILATA